MKKKKEIIIIITITIHYNNCDRNLKKNLEFLAFSFCLYLCDLTEIVGARYQKQTFLSPVNAFASLV